MTVQLEKTNNFHPHPSGHRTLHSHAFSKKITSNKGCRKQEYCRKQEEQNGKSPLGQCTLCHRFMISTSTSHNTSLISYKLWKIPLLFH